MIGSKSSSINSPNGEVSNIGSGDDLEMVHRATKVGKIVVDDNSSIQRERSTKSKRMEMIASKIDRASRVLFPSVFILYNIFYWTYY